jgi:hypothetical protein
MGKVRSLWVLVVFGVFALPGNADAYIGPGAGIGVIGTVVALLSAILFAIVGFVWYPIKRLLAAIRSRNAAQASADKATP